MFSAWSDSRMLVRKYPVAQITSFFSASFRARCTANGASGDVLWEKFESAVSSWTRNLTDTDAECDEKQVLFALCAAITRRSLVHVCRPTTTPMR